MSQRSDISEHLDARIEALAGHGLSVRAIAGVLAREGHSIGKSAIAARIRRLSDSEAGHIAAKPDAAPGAPDSSTTTAQVFDPAPFGAYVAWSMGLRQAGESPPPRPSWPEGLDPRRLAAQLAERLGAGRPGAGAAVGAFVAEMYDQLKAIAARATPPQPERPHGQEDRS